MSRNKNVVIIHGWGANSQSNWFPWLAEELRKRGFLVQAPDFPNTDFPQLRQWLEFFEQNVFLDENTILIGHSLGVPFILRLLERLPEREKVKASFLVSGFERSLGFPEAESFVEQSFDWDKIRQTCPHFVVIHSDNDPYLPLAIGKSLAKNLGVKPIIEHNAGHINAPGGHLSYPRLLELILNTPS